MDAAEIERRFVEAFIIPTRRARYLDALKKPEKRRRILRRLNHHFSTDLDVRCRAALPRGEQGVQEIALALARKGAPEEVGSGEGTVILGIPGQLAYYEAEDMNERYLLERIS